MTKLSKLLRAYQLQTRHNCVSNFGQFKTDFFKKLMRFDQCGCECPNEKVAERFLGEVDEKVELEIPKQKRRSGT